MKIARYFLVGAASAAIDISIYGFLTLVLSVHYLTAGASGFILATSVNYLLSVRYVFTSGARFTPHQEFVAVFGVSGIGLIVHQAVLFVCVDSLDIGLMAAKLIATGSTFLWNYSARARFVFASVK